MAHTGLATIYALMGRENEARAESAEVLRIDPKFSWDRWVKGLPFDQSRKDRMADALRKAETFEETMEHYRKVRREEGLEW